MAGVFEHHKRLHFDTFAISFGPDDGSDMRRRLERAFDTFIDVSTKTDEQIATLLRAHSIDIAVDLKGFTQHSRPEIFAQRVAPIQVNYLGYPGTTGADYMDYIIADRIVIPEEHQRFYSEKVVYLPDSYQCNDSARAIAQDTPSRAALGLPEQGFVFCCFNANYKITPAVFDIWMRLLDRAEGSVLWLLQSNASAARHLRREAERRNIKADRLIFAPPLPLAEHLARLRAADLFLDTLPCGAHTTASDALWAGLPVLTELGDSFAGRVAASLLHAVGLPDLVTQSGKDYEAKAFTLATDRAALAAVRERLQHNRDRYPLFDTYRFTRYLDAAFKEMMQRHRRGEPPAAIDLARYRADVQ
jgi:predicted O-linked N-acetylglucosamine transferase (SPINDLY family)